MRPALHDDEVRELMVAMEAAFPPVHRMTGAQARSAIAARPRAAAPAVDGVESADVTIIGPAGPLTVRVYRPRAATTTPLPAVVFLHGGGFVFCDLESHDLFCRRMTAGTGAVVFSIDYRLAPEHRSPAAAEDSYAALSWVAREAGALGIRSDRVAVAGDSAGGNLAAVVSLLARERGGPDLAAQVLVYPVIDPACDSASFAEYGTGCVNTAAAMRWYWRQYLGGSDLPSPPHHAAPLRADDHTGLPPAIIVTAGRDPLSDEGHEYAAGLRRSGVPVLHRHYPGLFHGFLTIDTLGPAIAARQLLWHDIGALLSTPREGTP